MSKPTEYSLDELASVLGVHRCTIQGWRRHWGMPSVKRGHYRIVPVRDFVAWAEEKGRPERRVAQERVRKALARGELSV